MHETVRIILMLLQRHIEDGNNLMYIMRPTVRELLLQIASILDCKLTWQAADSFEMRLKSFCNQRETAELNTG